MNGDVPFFVLASSSSSWLSGRVGHCGFQSVSGSTRTVNSTQRADCEIVKWGASATKRPHNHVLVVH